MKRLAFSSSFLAAVALFAPSACAIRVLSLEETPAPADAAAGPGDSFQVHLKARVRFDEPGEIGNSRIEVLCWELVDPPAAPIGQPAAPANADPITKPVGSNQPSASLDGQYRLLQTASAPEFLFAIPVDDLKLAGGRHRLLFTARATDATGRVSQAVAEPIRLQVVEPAVVTGERTVQKTIFRPVMEEKTKTYTVIAPNGQPEERTRTIKVSSIVPEVIEVQESEINPGSYMRVRTYSVTSAGGVSLADPNVAAELNRISRTHGVERERTRTVYFATNRAVIDPSARGVERFGKALGSSMQYGSALVRIPPTHFYGDEIQAPSWTWFDDPEKHFRVETLTDLGEAGFLAVMESCLGSEAGEDHQTKNDVLLYVHGFNTSMKFALLRLAQVAYDIGFEGAACAFVWPSDASKFGYRSDLTDATASVDALAGLLDRLGKSGSNGRVHIVAHSMGNFVTMQAIDRVDDRRRQLPEADRPRLGHVVLAAPDVWTEEFNQWAPSAVSVAQSVTHYHCKDDVPLKASVVFHEVKPRAGLASVLLLGLDNVNCDEANTTFLGHSAYADESPLLFDLQLLLQRDAAPAGRPLMQLDEPMQGYFRWKARPELAPAIVEAAGVVP